MPPKRKKVGRPPIKKLEKMAESLNNKNVRMSPVQYDCDLCSKSFVTTVGLKRHKKFCKRKVDVDINHTGDLKKLITAQKICNSVFTRKDNLMIHLRHHLKAKPYKCKVCSFETDKHKKLLTHARNKHSEKVFQCDHCGKITKSRMAIAKHLKTHGEKEFACDLCGYMTHTLEVMQRHVLRHTSDKPFKCPQCPRSFIQQCQLRTHVISHEGTICSHCGEKFPTQHSLVLHLRSLEGLDPLYCPFSDCRHSKVPFAYDHALEKHLLIHNEKSYMCPLCPKKFHMEVNLKRHLTIHTLDRPRRCLYCAASRAYIRGEMLVRHVRSRHPEIFKEHLTSVRQVLGFNDTEVRVRKCEIESMILRLDALENHVLQETRLGQDLYGGIEYVKESKEKDKMEVEYNPLMSEEELTENLRQLLAQLIDEKTLKYFGWPKESVDEVLEKVIEQCGQRAADRNRWSRVQCLRENTKYLFLHVIEDKTIARMLSTYTIDQVVRHILNVSQ
ncbi:Zinc finger protein 26 [Eumeta japonica]|uniref:Zinc finger protein 26 n=1 Tax=Eumeta variegata TaxID=151549 RepID=A0A4C1UEA9_EUMVA|nr:Zinc finger protein 26 [Eumeta japonica]